MNSYGIEYWGGILFCIGYYSRFKKKKLKMKVLKNVFLVKIMCICGGFYMKCVIWIIRIVVLKFFEKWFVKEVNFLD